MVPTKIHWDYTNANVPNHHVHLTVVAKNVVMTAAEIFVESARQIMTA